MPKKKKSRTQESKQVPSVTTHGNLELRKMEDIPDENALEKIKEKLLNEQPEFRQMFQYMEKRSREGINQAQDSSVVFTNRRGYVIPELLLQYPDSPTAKYTLEAYGHYLYAFDILWSYKKPRVLLQSDCDYLEPGLHHFIEGFMMAQYMLQQFPMVPSFTDLVEDYLKLRPNDILVEYIYVKALVTEKSKSLPDYERCKEIIPSLLKILFNKFASKNKHQNTSQTNPYDFIFICWEQKLLHRQTQNETSLLDAFEKCLCFR
ncbi:uncharacterized protein LOC132758873 [Ruditapes philippinarum]|uniref:uncharacterized protein LOC132758873 n=1 Tax=Ruditapes philippinarum TaxID=129788 RepID=UPI00295A6420|nr:uncharacterized protein LOC132758873 [Ruditapes philippinarum]